VWILATQPAKRKLRELIITRIRILAVFTG